MMWYWSTGAPGWMWGLGIVTTILFWVLIVWGIIALLGWVRHGGMSSPGPDGPSRDPGPVPNDDPELILARRYAAGEIDAEEYHQRLEFLRSSHQQAAPPAESRSDG